jgi:DNA repair exonuclease SbcCD ATPase subunit
VKEITFKSIAIQNFLSFGNNITNIDFSKGINVITGENKDKGGKNGIGKSAIADAIFWCLFGNTIRELKKDKIQHNQNKETCKVELIFEVKDTVTKEYKITRILEPSKIEILCNNKNITLSTIPKNDEFIKELINANEEVFNNAVIMSANNTIPFMAQKKTEKRKFIEGILRLDIFGDMLLRARSNFNDVKKENDICSNNFINEQRNLDIFKKQKEKGEENKNIKIKEFENKIDDCEKTLKTLKEQKLPSLKDLKDKNKQILDKIDTLEKGYKNQNRECIKISEKISNIKYQITQKQKQKNEFLEKGTKCPVCNRDYCEEDIHLVNEKVQNIDNEIDELKNQITILIKEQEKCSDLTSKIEDGIRKLKEQENKIKDTASKIVLNDQKINNISDKIEEYKNYIVDIKNEKHDYEKYITDSKNKIKTLENELNEIKKELKILNSVKFVLSEEGVKTYIVKKIINVLNNRLNYYLNRLEAPCKCIFDEMFDETIINDKGKEASYFNFSGGERKRIDTAILFTFQDVLRLHSGTSFSLNIYDELLDCALDTRGTDKILEILKEKVEKYNESIYIVSHKQSDILNIDKILYLEKNDGVTTIVS